MKKIVLVFASLLLFGALSVSAQRLVIAYSDTTTMSSPGNSSALSCVGYNWIAWYFKVASINTSVGVALQLKSGDGRWTAVMSDSLVYDGNGDFGLLCQIPSIADSVRFKWISEGGGTSAIITHNAQLSGGN
jgi:hypothetical protein